MLILRTQIARTHGLRKDFTGAREVLQSIAEPIRRAGPEARARWWLELGRTWSSAAHASDTPTPEAKAQARADFHRAVAIAQAAHLDAITVDVALVLRERGHDAEATRGARWMVAWTLRSLGRDDEALAMQLRLEQDNAAANDPDRSVFEKLEALYRARGDGDRAAHYAALKVATPQ